MPSVDGGVICVVTKLFRGALTIAVGVDDRIGWAFVIIAYCYFLYPCLRYDHIVKQFKIVFLPVQMIQYFQQNQPVIPIWNVAGYEQHPIDHALDIGVIYYGEPCLFKGSP